MMFEKFVHSSVGKKKLKKWFLTPTYDILILQKRLDGIRFLEKNFSRETII